MKFRLVAWKSQGSFETFSELIWCFFSLQIKLMKSENVQFSFLYYAAHFSNKIQQWNKLNSSLKCKKAQRTKRKMDKEKKRIKIVQYSIIKVERKENQPFLFRSSTQYWWQFHFYLWVFEFPVSGGKISISRFSLSFIFFFLQRILR